jgi:hypothetical protein
LVKDAKIGGRAIGRELRRTRAGIRSKPDLQWLRISAERTMSPACGRNRKRDSGLEPCLVEA